MAIAPPFDPKQWLRCTDCPWEGEAGESDHKPADLCRCPKCKAVLVRCDIPDGVRVKIGDLFIGLDGKGQGKVRLGDLCLFGQKITIICEPRQPPRVQVEFLAS